MTQPHPYQPQGQQPQEPYGYQQAPDYPPAASVQYESYPPAVAVPQPYDPAYQPYDPAHQSPLAPYQPYAAPFPAVDPGRNLGVAGLVIGLGCWWLPYVGLLAPMLALILGISGFNRSKAVGIRNNVALAAAIVGAVEIALGVLVVLGFVLFVVTQA